MRIAIFGAGGVGGCFGAYLARSGADVTFIARGMHLRALHERGLRIENAQGAFTVDPVKVTDDPHSVSADVVLVCVKTYQLEAALADIGAMLGDTAFVVPLMNSVEGAAILASRLGPQRVLGGLCYTVSYLLEPGVVRSDRGPTIIFGELDRSLSDRARRLEQVIDAAEGIFCKNSANIQYEMWKKFTWVSAAGAVGAVTRVTTDIWRDLPETRALFENALREGHATAAAYGVTLDENDIAERMVFLDKTPMSRTSMQRDMEAGHRSEMPEQIGSLVRLAKQKNVAVPLSQALYAALLPQELAAQAAASN